MKKAVPTVKNLEQLFYENMMQIGFAKFDIEKYKDKFKQALERYEQSNGQTQYADEQWVNTIWNEVKVEMFFKYKEKELMFEKFPQNQLENWFEHELAKQVMIAVYTNSTIIE